METTAALTTNTFKLTGKMKPLEPEIQKLQEEYEIMKKNREQAKADLQAKFDEVYEYYMLIQNSKINQAKQLFVQQSVERNKQIQEFQKKHLTNIENLQTHHNEQHKQFQEQSDIRIELLNTGIVKLDKAMDQEREDRIRTEKENIAAIQNSIDTLFTNFEWEKQTRMDNEKKNLKFIKDTANQVSSDITANSNDREAKFKQLEEHTTHSLKSQDQFSEGFKERTMKEFHLEIDQFENEMDNRFDHQDKVVGNLSQMITTIQETLAILGKDV